MGSGGRINMPAHQNSLAGVVSVQEHVIRQGFPEQADGQGVCMKPRSERLKEGRHWSRDEALVVDYSSVALQRSPRQLVRGA